MLREWGRRWHEGLSQMAFWLPPVIKDEVHMFQVAPRKRWFLSICQVIVLARKGCLCAGVLTVRRVERAPLEMMLEGGH